MLKVNISVVKFEYWFQLWGLSLRGYKLLSLRAFKLGNNYGTTFDVLHVVLSYIGIVITQVQNDWIMSITDNTNVCKSFTTYTCNTMLFITILNIFTCNYVVTIYCTTKY